MIPFTKVIWRYTTLVKLFKFEDWMGHIKPTLYDRNPKARILHLGKCVP